MQNNPKSPSESAHPAGWRIATLFLSRKHVFYLSGLGLFIIIAIISVLAVILHKKSSQDSVSESRPSDLPPLPPLASKTNRSLIGIYAYENEFSESYDRILGTEAWAGVHFPVLHFFSAWCPAVDPSKTWYYSLVNQRLNAIWSHGSIPFFSWQPACFDPASPNSFVSDIGKGYHDDYISKMASQIKQFLAGPDGKYGTDDDRRIYIRLGHEMNGNWYPWSSAKNPQASTQSYISMWKRTWEVFTATLSSDSLSGIGTNMTSSIDHRRRIQWVWCPNNFDTGGVAAEDYYPGNRFVDWLAYDVYNGATAFNRGWGRALDLVRPMYLRLNRLMASQEDLVVKPIAIPEYGCNYQEDPGLAGKSEWISELHNFVFESNIKLAIYFNVDNWSVFSISGTIPNVTVYREIARNANRTIYADRNSTRVVSDEAFLGL
ncbi:glycoside hydrolase superfamily, partial [Cladochytrium replicatum]